MSEQERTGVRAHAMNYTAFTGGKDPARGLINMLPLPTANSYSKNATHSQSPGFRAVLQLPERLFMLLVFLRKFAFCVVFVWVLKVRQPQN